MICWETCYWNLIEEKWCFDPSIALYEEPVKNLNEKNNNMFDNMAFYDSVSVIAGRAIVTIDPLDVKRPSPHESHKPDVIMNQPKTRLIWTEKKTRNIDAEYLKKSAQINEELVSNSTTTDTDAAETDTQVKRLFRKTPPRLTEKYPIKKSVSFHNIPDKTSSSSSDESDYRIKTRSLMVPEEEEVTLRPRSLRERRMSKSLSLKIGDIPKEIPIIRQNSMPKFYLDTPDENQLRDSSLVNNAAFILKSPMTSSNEFTFDLYSVVQIEKNRQSTQSKNPPAPIHRETSKLNLLKDRIMLKKSKSTVSASSVPCSNHI